MSDKDYLELGKFIYEYLDYEDYILWEHGEDGYQKKLNLEESMYFFDRDWKMLLDERKKYFFEMMELRKEIKKLKEEQ